MFPCGCQRDACGNTVGRVEFNPSRVRTHFIHTIMRLEMENRQQCSNNSSNNSSSIMSSAGTGDAGSSSTIGAGYYGSNYSSGYASPAYNTSNNTEQSLYNTASSHQQHQNTTTHHYAMDSLDSSIYSSNTTTATPSYGEVMPSYSNVESSAGVSIYDDLGYGNSNNNSDGLPIEVRFFAKIRLIMLIRKFLL